MTPTEEQIKRFWEWCGFKFFRPYEGGAIDVIPPEGSMYLSPSKMAIPEPDLNTLFKWAVPRLLPMLENRFSPVTNKQRALQLLFDRWLNEIHEGIELEDALFWAIYKAAGLEEKMKDWKAENPYNPTDLDYGLSVAPLSPREMEDLCRQIFDDGCQAQAKKLVEWEDELCKEHNKVPNLPAMPRRCCEHCWQSLKEELGL